MDLSTAETQALIAFFIFCITVLPALGLAIRNYIASKYLQVQLDNRPTHDSVNDKITLAIAQALKNKDDVSG
jgi:hypothetical protein